MTTPPNRRLGLAWLILCVGFALHVVDEALSDFLDVYNPAVRAIRERVPLLPLPTFTFEGWLTALIGAVTALVLLIPWAFQGARWIRRPAYVFALVMLANGVAHLGISAATGRLMPGVYSSPLLVGAALYVLVNLRRTAVRPATLPEPHGP